MEDPRKLQLFIGIRVEEIKELFDNDLWYKVPTRENPADDATKFSAATKYNSNSRWFKGPYFLYDVPENWPNEMNLYTPAPECTLCINTTSFISYTAWPKEKYSKYKKLLNVTAYTLQFIKVLKARLDSNIKLDWNSINLTISELDEAERVLVRIAQTDTYKQDYLALYNNQPLPNNSTLKSLNPIMSDDKIMRIGGRLDASSDLHYNTKYPIILPRRHTIVKLLLQYYHEKYHHVLFEAVLNEVRYKFWVINGRAALKEVIRSCQYCKNLKAKPLQPKMGQLPAFRLDTIVQKPFWYTGVDYFGPLTVIKFRRQEKTYGVIFTCLVTRATHLELANSLTTDSCIIALRNFINRRGPVSQIYSDNGTNLVGTANEIKKINADLKEYSACYHIEWHFNPPAASHFGGCYERCIGITKTLLQSTLSQPVTEEVLRSALIECENILNSRPLSYVSSNALDEDPITPHHLLNNFANDQSSWSTSRKLSVKEQYKKTQALANIFWDKLRKVYVPSLLNHKKWHDNNASLKVGDIVLMLNNEEPRNRYKKAIVRQVFTGPDGPVRVVEIESNNKSYKQPVNKLIKLEVLDPACSNTGPGMSSPV